MNHTHFPLPYRSHPLILLPVTPGMAARWTIALGLPNHSWKKRAARMVACFLAPLLGPRTPLAPWLVSLPARPRALLDQLATESELLGSGGVVVLMSPVAGRHRIYIRHIDTTGRVLAYTKIGFGPEDSACFTRESEALTLFAENSAFVVPRVLAKGENAEIGAYLITAALDPSFCSRPTRSENLLKILKDAFAGSVQTCHRLDLAERWWYRQGIARLNTPMREHFAQLIAKPDPLLVCCVHGDVGGENIYSSPEGRFAIIDWESFDSKAPMMTDVVSHWIGLHSVALRAQKRMERERFLKYFSHSYDDLAFALLFLVATDIPEARTLLTALCDTRGRAE